MCAGGGEGGGTHAGGGGGATGVGAGVAVDASADSLLSSLPSPGPIKPESRCRFTAFALNPPAGGEPASLPPAAPTWEMSSLGGVLSSRCFATAKPTREPEPAPARSKMVTKRRKNGSPKINSGPLGGGTSKDMKESEHSEPELSM